MGDKIMSLYHLESTDKSIGTEYNIEFKWANEKIHTFSGTLENVDKESFWFRVDGCISKLNQDRIIWMLPVPKKNQNVEFIVKIGDRFESNDKQIYTVVGVSRRSDSVFYKISTLSTIREVHENLLNDKNVFWKIN